MINALKSKTIPFCIVAWLSVFLSNSALAGRLFYDDFSQQYISSLIWHIPKHEDEPLGRTLFNTMSFPEIQNGNAIITVSLYNPQYLSGTYFYGTDLKSVRLIPLRKKVHVKIRAKMNTTVPGIVGGIFLFAFRPDSTDLHDEIDFEMVTTEPSLIMTNSYRNEPLGKGHPQLTKYESGTIADYHLYEIIWEPDKVSWLLDGKLIRVETERVPVIPMELHLNTWIPDADWPQAYNAILQPVATKEEDQEYSMSVDFIEIRAPSNFAPIFHLLLNKP
jgi:hypothetical protein